MMIGGSADTLACHSVRSEFQAVAGMGVEPTSHECSDQKLLWIRTKEHLALLPRYLFGKEVATVVTGTWTATESNLQPGSCAWHGGCHDKSNSITRS